ncbi:MAG TPA: bifunctional 3,4-dihydroxy-2-butanone-4-phosphate synthase/GTP cyclohydrolase II [Bacteroidales bacterium]|nr:bifunctional 3,4-dihydroxy-2-butanone-4-phosphate synthase/GTP cyclohydrolase II [Bacteroidales bacterium]
MHPKLNSIPEAIEEIKKGKVVIVVDDENRENEGDFIAAAEAITPEIVNFMATHGRGLICAPITGDRCDRLRLDLMVPRNTALHETSFTISVDLKGLGCTTGISASDRAKTIKALADPLTLPEDLARPGHIFPIRSREGGVLQRAGHTEASIDLARLAGFQPAGVLVEIMNDEGNMARLPELMDMARKFNLKIITIEDLISYRIKNESLIEKEVSVELPTEWGTFKLTAYRQTTNQKLHLALTKGTWEPSEEILVRVHSSCVTGDIFGSCKCDCGGQLHKAMQLVEEHGKGIILYLNQEGRGIGLLNKLKAYHLQENGMDTVEANLELGFRADEREYGIGAQILRDLGARRIRLISNNPSKKTGLAAYDIEISSTIPLIIPDNQHRQRYIDTKRHKLGHNL